MVFFFDNLLQLSYGCIDNLLQLSYG